MNNPKSPVLPRFSHMSAPGLPTEAIFGSLYILRHTTFANLRDAVEFMEGDLECLMNYHFKQPWLMGRC